MSIVSYRQTDNSLIRVRGSKIHNRGVFAAKAIPRGTRIIEYTGEKITKAESDRRDERGDDTIYVFTLNSRHDIDGASGGSEAILLNHSCEPNCEASIIKGRIWISALRDIGEGEELAYDYNFDVRHHNESPCRCGASSCRRYIVGKEKWQAFIRRMVRKGDVKRLRAYGYDKNGKRIAT